MKKITKAFIIAVFSVLGGILYRLGGIGKPFNTKVRDFGVPAVALGLLALLGGTAPWWIWLISFVWMFGTMTTYFEFDGNGDTDWYEWLLTGFMVGLSLLPYAWFNGVWLWFCIRIAVLTLGTMIWCEVVDNDTLEEGGRGVLFVATMPLLLI